MKLLKSHATESEVQVQLDALMQGAQAKFMERLKFAGTGVDAIHDAFEKALADTKMIFDESKIDGIVPALPSGQKNAFAEDRRKVIE